MNNLINVSLIFGSESIPIGRLITNEKRIYFEFVASFINKGFPISPIRLQIKPGVQTFDPYLFEGLPGVFNDSLPDGWGRLLFDRLMRTHGINPAELTPLDRLAYVGRFGLGALVYEPDLSQHDTSSNLVNLDVIAKHTQEVLDGNSSDVLDSLVDLNGSSAGARPKALIGVNASKSSIIHGVCDIPSTYQHWLVKFANQNDGNDIGAIEFAYAQMARLAGVKITDTYLFPAKNSAGYFAIKRFDRDGNNRLHLHTVCGLLHSDFRMPSLDYEDLLQLTLALTKDMQEVERMYRLAVFNVLAHNRDDHSKNFSYLMDAQGNWVLSPAYDLVFSFGPNGEQSTMVMGEGRNPGVKQLLQLAVAASIKSTKAHEIIAQCQDALAQWPLLALNAGVSTARIKEIAAKIACV